MIVVVRLDVVVALGGGGGVGAPGESICPAKAETARAKQRIATAHVWRRVFIVASHSDVKKFA
jgi:hypothetical protein